MLRRDWLETNGWQNAPANSATAVRFAVVLTTSPIQVDLGKVPVAAAYRFLAFLVDPTFEAPSPKASYGRLERP